MSKENRLPEYWYVPIFGKDRNTPAFRSLLKYCKEEGRNIATFRSDFNFYGKVKNSSFGGFDCGNEELFFKDYATKITLDQFISMTEEKEEWKPKKGDKILVADEFDQKMGYWHIRTFLEMRKDGFYKCSDSFMDWKYARPFEEPEPFEPTIGKVCYMKAEGEEGNYVFVGKLGDKFMGCDVDEYADMLENYGGLVELFDSVSPVKKVVNTTPEVILKALGSDPGSDLEIDGYVKERDIPSIYSIIGR